MWGCGRVYGRTAIAAAVGDEIVFDWAKGGVSDANGGDAMGRSLRSAHGGAVSAGPTYSPRAADAGAGAAPTDS